MSEATNNAGLIPRPQCPFCFHYKVSERAVSNHIHSDVYCRNKSLEKSSSISPLHVLGGNFDDDDSIDHLGSPHDGETHGEVEYFPTSPPLPSNLPPQAFDDCCVDEDRYSDSSEVDSDTIDELESLGNLPQTPTGIGLASADDPSNSESPARNDEINASTASTSESVLPPDGDTRASIAITSLMDRRAAHKDNGDQATKLSDQEISNVELLHLLNINNISKGCYKSFKKWARDAHYKNVAHTGSLDSKSMLKKLAERYDTDEMRPKTIRVYLTASKLTVDIVIHEFLAQIYSLLNDDYLMQDKNLLFRNDDPLWHPKTEVVSPPPDISHNGTDNDGSAVDEPSFAEEDKNGDTIIDGVNMGKIDPRHIYNIDEDIDDDLGAEEPLSHTGVNSPDGVPMSPSSTRRAAALRDDDIDFRDVDSMLKKMKPALDKELIDAINLKGAKEEHVYDITEGDVFKSAVIEYVKFPGVEMLVPILLFIDKSYGDTHGRLTFEPIAFTLGIFNVATRKLQRAWRPLGYVMNQSHIRKKLTAEQKSEDYHCVLSAILKSLEDVQQTDGIKWSFKYQGHEFDVVMKVPILFVIGDTEGHDKLCGHYTCRLNGVNHICRYCNVPFPLTGNPHWTNCPSLYRQTKGPTIASLAEEEEFDELHSKSYYGIRNAFSKLHFCDPVRGINGACCSELLHLIQHGIFLYFLAGLFGGGRASKSKRKKKKESDNEKKGTGKRKSTTSQPDGSDSDDDLFNPGDVFFDDGEHDTDAYKCIWSPAESMKADFNDLSMIYGTLISRQSDKEYERATFPDGITSAAKKFGTEERCRLVLFLVINASIHGRKFEAAMQHPGRLFSILLVGSHLLLLEHFFRSPEIHREDIFQLYYYMPIFMGLFANAIRRTAGNAMNFVKFHLLLHFVEDLQRFGIALCFDGSPCESHHKGFKGDIEKTQKTAKHLERQMAENYHHRHTVDCAVRDLNGASPLKPRDRYRDALVLAGDTVEDYITARDSWHSLNERKAVTGCHYIVTSEGMFRAPVNGSDKRVRLAQWIDRSLKERVTSFLQEHVLVNIQSPCVSLFTKLNQGIEKFNGMAYYHASPEDPQSGLEGISPYCGRHDWVNILRSKLPNEPGLEDCVEMKHLVPHRLIIFFVVTDLLTPTPDVPCNGVYAVSTTIGHSLDDAIKDTTIPKHPTADLRADPICPLLFWSPIVSTTVAEQKQPILSIVRPLIHFHSPQIAVPYDLNDTQQSEWLFMLPRSVWMPIFRGGMDEVLKMELVTRRHKRKKAARKRGLASVAAAERQAAVRKRLAARKKADKKRKRQP